MITKKPHPTDCPVCRCQHVYHVVGTNSVCRFCDLLEPVEDACRRLGVEQVEQVEQVTTRWFNLLGLMAYVGARKLRPGENEGWGNRFRAVVHHEPQSYTAGFNNPSFGLTLELAGWRFDLGAEY